MWWSSVLDSALPPQRLRPNTRLEHQDPASHTAQKKRRREKKQKNQNELTDPYDKWLKQTYTGKIHKEAYTYTFTKREKGKKNVYIKKKKEREQPNQ